MITVLGIIQFNQVYCQAKKKVIFVGRKKKSLFAVSDSCRWWWP
jgi:hypothetical protein